MFNGATILMEKISGGIRCGIGEVLSGRREFLLFSNSDWLWITGIHIAAWLVLYRLGKGKMDVFDPFYFTSAIFALVFIYGPNVWISRGQTTYQGVEVMEYMPEAMLVFNIGYFFYSLASFGISRRRYGVMLKGADEDIHFSNFLDEPDVKAYIVRFAWVVFIVSMVLSLIYYRLTGRSLLFMITLGQGAELDYIRSGYGIYFLVEFVRSAIPGCLLLIAFSPKNRFLIYICTFILCAVCISSGSRNLAICVVMAIVVYRYMKEGKRPSLAMLAIAIVALYFFVGLMGIFRTTIKTGGEIDFSNVNSASVFTAFMYNIEIFYPFFTLVGMIKRNIIFYHYGLGILNIVLQFVPRAIWSTKPAMLGKTAFEAMYGSSMGGAAYPNIGEFYYEFGILGVIGLMAVFGYAMRRIFQSSRYSTNKMKLVTYAIMYGYLLQFICRGHFASWAIDFVFMFGPLFYLNRKLKRMYYQSSLKEEKI